MQESCLEDRLPILTAGAEWVLRRPYCGHLDDLRWQDEPGVR